VDNYKQIFNTLERANSRLEYEFGFCIITGSGVFEAVNKEDEYFIAMD